MMVDSESEIDSNILRRIQNSLLNLRAETIHSKQDNRGFHLENV